MTHSNFRSTRITAIAALVTLSGIANVGQAYLGGFEQQDGYESLGIWDQPPLNRAWDVSQYNAGQYGANAVPANSYQPGTGGLWTKTQGTVVSTGVLPANGVYATSHPPIPNALQPFEGDRALVITTNNLGWDAAPQIYEYQVDSLDLQGVDPSTTAGSTVNLSWWSCAQLFGTDEPVGFRGGLGAGATGNIVDFVDSAGSVGIGVGYIQPGTGLDNIAYRIGGQLVDTGIQVPDIKGWHQFRLSLDLAADRAILAVVPQEGAMPIEMYSGPISPMGDLSSLRFTSTPGVNSIKAWALDDFEFDSVVIPEPASAFLVVAAMAGAMRRRR